LRKLETCYRQHGFEGDKFVASYEVVISSLHPTRSSTGMRGLMPLRE
jgi:hypothetical protein